MPALRLLLFTLAAVLPSLAAALEHVEICRYCEGRACRLDAESESAKHRRYAPDRLVDVLRIKIDVTPDFDARTVEGLTTITFAPISKPVDELRLNATKLRVDSVTGSEDVSEFVATDEELTILFAAPIPVGQQASVTVRYSAEPQKGIYFRTEAMGYPAGDDHLFTQGETHEAPHWFPCFDYPNERSSTEVICRVPPEMTVLSNGRMVSEAVDGQTGLKAVHWVQEKPHVSYLVCLCAGHFHRLEKSHGDLRLRFFSQPSLAEHAANSFRDTDRIMAFFEEEIGLPFPWEKYDQVTCRDFVAGGMENTTLTTLTHRTIFSDATENLRSSRNLDAHETAHQWFGDLVTCEDWSHLWLNEGFATYYTHLYNEHKLGRDELLYGLYRDAGGRVLSAEDDTRPIVWRGYKDPWEQFDFRAYPKGSWVLHMLRTRLGKDVYRRAITSYLQKHALTSVVTADLVAELEDASGQSLDQFFDQYVYHGGFPRLKIKHKWLPKEKLAHVHIEQTQEVNDEVLLFHLPTKLRFHVDGEVVDHEIEITSAKHDFYVPLDKKPAVVRFDPEYGVLGKVDIDKPQEMVEEQLRLEGDVIGRLMAAEALGEEENKKAVAALRAALNGDDFYGVRVVAAKSLSKIHTDEAYAALAESMRQEDARVRLQVVTELGKFYRPEAVEKLLAVAGEEPNPLIAAEAVTALGKFGEDRVVRTVSAAMDARSLHNSKALAAVQAAGALLDNRLRVRVLEVLRQRRHDFGGRPYGGALAAVASLWKDADDKTPAFELLTEGLNDPARRVRRDAAAALGVLADRRALPLLTALSETRSDRVGAAAKDAIEKINSDAPTSPKEVKELRELVQDLVKQQKKLQESVDELSGRPDPDYED